MLTPTYSVRSMVIIYENTEYSVPTFSLVWYDQRSTPRIPVSYTWKVGLRVFTCMRAQNFLLSTARVIVRYLFDQDLTTEYGVLDRSGQCPILKAPRNVKLSLNKFSNGHIYGT